MENGLYEVGEVIVDKGVFTKYEGFSPQCLLYTNAYATHQENWGTPGLTAPHSLEVSCNYFYYELGERMTIEMLDAMAKGLGLGEPTGIELPEVIGHRSNPESKAAQYTGMQAQWFAGDRILTSIGQAENRFTPMQLCVYTATLANQGVRMKATFLSRVVSADYRTLVRENEPVVMDTTEISDDTYITYVNGMRDVIVGPEGTGRGDFGGPKDYILDENGMWPYPEIRVCAKTGTAQTFKDRSDNGAYVCFAPMEDPQIAIAIYGERVAHGSTLGVVAEEIMRAYFALGDSGDVIVYENKLS
jgi:penicillin-binding protein 2